MADHISVTDKTPNNCSWFDFDLREFCLHLNDSLNFSDITKIFNV